MHGDFRLDNMIFDKQNNDYKNKLIPERRCIKDTLEAGIKRGWEKYD